MALCYDACLAMTATPSHNNIREFATILILLKVPSPYTPNDLKQIIYEQKNMFKMHLSGSVPSPPIDESATLTPAKAARASNPQATVDNFKQWLHRHMIRRMGKTIGVYKFDVDQVIFSHSFVNRRERIFNRFVLRTVNKRVIDACNARTKAETRGRKKKNPVPVAPVAPTPVVEPSTSASFHEETVSGAAFAVQNALIRGKQCAVGAAIIDWDTILADDVEARDFMKSDDFGVNSTKCQMIKALFDRRIDITREKVLVGSFFVEYLKKLKEMFKRMGIKCVIITGKIKLHEERKRLEQKFQHDPRVRICLISLLVAQCITLTAASKLILADRWFSNGPTKQIIGRLARMSQLSPLIVVIFLVIDKSVETHVHRMTDMKIETNETLMNTGIDYTRPPRNEMLNLEQLRKDLASCTDENASGEEEINVIDEWADKYGGPRIRIDLRADDVVTEYEITIMKRAISALINRGDTNEARKEIIKKLRMLDEDFSV